MKKPIKGDKKILNDSIRARNIQLISDEGENLGTFGLAEARAKAETLGLDLMQMSENGNTAIVKMLDYGKFLYKQKKQIQKNKQRTKRPEMKTLRISFKIGEHDLEVKRKQVEKFSAGGHPLKLTLMLRGRENCYQDIAREKINLFVDMISEFYKIDGKIMKHGNNFLVTFLPIK